MATLADLGWTEALAAAFAGLGEAELCPARVILDHGRYYRVSDGAIETLSVASGRLRHEAQASAELPAVGDWVAIRQPQGEKLASIRALLPRTGKFSRRRAGLRSTEQVVAANVDKVFLLMG